MARLLIFKGKIKLGGIKMNKNVKIINLIMALMFVLLFSSITNASEIDIYFSYSDFEYAPYRVNFAGNFYLNFDRLLSPYGYWVIIKPVGRVWIPYVYRTWRPYYYGYWIYTVYGPTWISYEPWGWLTHHYGRWFYYPVYGWCWLPSYTWGPAWVEWNIYDDFVAWRPSPPPNLYNNYYYNNYEFSNYVIINAKNFFDKDVNRYKLIDLRVKEKNRIMHKAPDKNYFEIKASLRVNTVSLKKNYLNIEGNKAYYYTPDGQLNYVYQRIKTIKNVVPVSINETKDFKNKIMMNDDKFSVNTGKMNKEIDSSNIKQNNIYWEDNDRRYIENRYSEPLKNKNEGDNSVDLMRNRKKNIETRDLIDSEPNNEPNNNKMNFNKGELRNKKAPYTDEEDYFVKKPLNKSSDALDNNKIDKNHNFRRK